MQAFLNLPKTLFKSEHAQIYFNFTKEKPHVTKSVEVLLANIPDFKNPHQFQSFIAELNDWLVTNHPEN